MRVAETGERHRSADESAVIPVRLGTHLVGSLALQGARLSPTTRDSIASLLAINYERVRALDRAAAAEVARRNEEFKSSLLDGLAHDLKTPLTAIRTCVTRLITLPPRTEEVRQELLEHHRSGIRTPAALHHRSHRTRPHRIAGTAACIASRLPSPVWSAAPSPKRATKTCARYRIEVPADLELDIDAGLVRRALMQFLENARKYAPPDSPIEIQARILDGQATISVLDRGPGISPDELERVFEKFYRGRRRPAAKWKALAWASQLQKELSKRTAERSARNSARAAVRPFRSPCPLSVPVTQ